MKEPNGPYENLRNRVTALTKMGISVKAISDGSTVNYTALHKWLKENRPLKDSQAVAVENFIEEFKQRINSI